MTRTQRRKAKRAAYRVLALDRKLTRRGLPRAIPSGPAMRKRIIRLARYL